MSSSERRSDVRLPYYCEAKLEGLDVGRSTCRLADISVGGAFVEARTLLPVGTVARLQFRLAGREVTADAEVRYTCPDVGMGLRFVNLAPADRYLILSFVVGQSALQSRTA
jgi:hypothetical protein